MDILVEVSLESENLSWFLFFKVEKFMVDRDNVCCIRRDLTSEQNFDLSGLSCSVLIAHFHGDNKHLFFFNRRSQTLLVEPFPGLYNYSNFCLGADKKKKNFA